MQVLILGATGRTGSELVKQALGHGHGVRALARDPDRLKMVHPRLEIVRGDLGDAKSLDRAVAGQDAVLSAIGVNERKPNTILSDGTRNLVAAMDRQGVKRLLFLSALGVGDAKGRMGPLISWIIIPTLLKHVFADKEKAEEVVRGSDLEWTLVRPGRLTSRRLTGRHRSGPAAKGGLFPHIPRADVADFMLETLEHNRYVRQAPAVRS